MGVIYKATCLQSGKSYIGQTKKTLDERKREHERAKDNYAFHVAMRKYGVQAFIWEILEECSNDKLDEREIYWINHFDTYNKGYNLTLGGDNATALINWINSHKQESQANALNGLKYAQQYNQEHKEEHLNQLAKARQKAIKACSRKVHCIELDLIFDSLSDAERWSQTPANPKGKRCAHQHISKVCKGQRKTAGGYSWEYV